MQSCSPTNRNNSSVILDPFMYNLKFEIHFPERRRNMGRGIILGEIYRQSQRQEIAFNFFQHIIGRTKHSRTVLVKRLTLSSQASNMIHNIFRR